MKSRELVLMTGPIRRHRLPVREVQWLPDRLRGDCLPVPASSVQVERRLSPICVKGYRAGLKPPNWQKRGVRISRGRARLTGRCVRTRIEQRGTSLAYLFMCRSYLFDRCMTTSRPPRSTRKTPWQERFWRYVPTDRKPDECWEWQAARNENGYGYLGGDGGGAQALRAHRASYIVHFGAIPDGHMVCHRCDNRACVNPAHLFAASQGDNLRDMARKGRGGRGMYRPGDQHPGTKYTDADVRRIRELAARGVPYAELCRRYGTTRFYISSLVRGQQRASAGGAIRTAAPNTHLHTHKEDQ